MAEEASSLTQTFGKVAKHIFSVTMIAMMISVALPAVAAAVPAGAATVSDIGLGLVDHYITMFTAPFEHAGTIGDAFNNARAGDFAPSGYYELGGGGHAAHGAATAAATAHVGSHAAASGTAAAAHGTGAAMAHGTCAPFADWQAGLSATDLSSIQDDADALGQSMSDYYNTNLCMSH